MYGNFKLKQRAMDMSRHWAKLSFNYIYTRFECHLKLNEAKVIRSFYFEIVHKLFKKYGEETCYTASV
jgi:hypothetical protein